MRSDILGILKNAMERGEDIHKVGQSLANAGYPIVEVQTAMSSLGGGVIGSLSQKTPPQMQLQTQTSKPVSSTSQMPQPQQKQMQPLPSIKPEQPQHKGRAKVIILIAILVVLIAALTATIIFKDKIISLFS